MNYCTFVINVRLVVCSNHWKMRHVLSMFECRYFICDQSNRFEPKVNSKSRVLKQVMLVFIVESRNVDITSSVVCMPFGFCVYFFMSEMTCISREWAQLDDKYPWYTTIHVSAERWIRCTCSKMIVVVLGSKTWLH